MPCLQNHAGAPEFDCVHKLQVILPRPRTLPVHPKEARASEIAGNLLDLNCI